MEEGVLLVVGLEVREGGLKDAKGCEREWVEECKREGVVSRGYVERVYFREGVMSRRCLIPLQAIECIGDRPSVEWARATHDGSG